MEHVSGDNYNVFVKNLIKELFFKTLAKQFTLYGAHGKAAFHSTLSFRCIKSNASKFYLVTFIYIKMFSQLDVVQSRFNDARNDSICRSVGRYLTTGGTVPKRGHPAYEEEDEYAN